MIEVLILSIENSDIMKAQKGFTLIELILVIILLSILSVVAIPRFLNFAEDANRAAFKGIASAFRGGVDQVHIAWLVRANGQAVQDFIPISDPAVLGDLSVNSFGYPADTRGTSLTLNSTNDCLDVWRAVLSTQDASVNNNSNQTFQGVYLGGGSCRYTYNAEPSFTVVYNSITGEITIND